MSENEAILRLSNYPSLNRFVLSQHRRFLGLREDSQIDFVTRNVLWAFLSDPHPPSRETSTGQHSKNRCL